MTGTDPCRADGPREYGPTPVIDPRGPEGDHALRVTRGGSWNDEPWMLRAPCRIHRRRDVRNVFLGFRFALTCTRQADERKTDPPAPRPALSKKPTQQKTK